MADIAISGNSGLQRLQDPVSAPRNDNQGAQATPAQTPQQDAASDANQVGEPQPLQAAPAGNQAPQQQPEPANDAPPPSGDGDRGQYLDISA